MAVVKLQVSLPYSRIGMTAALSSLSFIARLISCLLKTFSYNLRNVTLARDIHIHVGLRPTLVA